MKDDRYRHRSDRMVLDPDGDYIHISDVRDIQAENRPGW